MTFHLRELPAGVRLSLTALLGVMLIGIASAMIHLEDHHENRDDRPGVSLDDLVGAYHGVNVPAPLVSALERGHPEALPAADREHLVKWLKGTKVSEQYDDPDQGARVPAEILAKNCVSCHGRKSTDPSHIGERIPLEFFDDVKKVAFARQIDPVPAKIVVASAHTHALALAPLGVVVVALLWFTRWSSRLRSLVSLAVGLGLFLDFASWWLTRQSAGMIWLLILSGAAFAGGLVLASLLILLDLWLPHRAPVVALDGTACTTE